MLNEIRTDRLLLRKMESEDAPMLYKIWSDPFVTKFMNVDSFTEEEQAVEMINFLNQLADEEKAFRFTIVELETNAVIGSCGFNTLDFDNYKTEIGYDLAKEKWGNGFATEAVTVLLKFAFQKLNMHRVEAKVEPANINSIKLLEKLGFTFEGTLRQSEKSKGKFIDLNMYSKLKGE